MSKCSYEELKQELGKAYGMEAMDDEKTQSRVIHGGGDIVFIDFEDGRIETELCERWRKAVAPSGSTALKLASNKPPRAKPRPHLGVVCMTETCYNFS